MTENITRDSSYLPLAEDAIVSCDRSFDTLFDTPIRRNPTTTGVTRLRFNSRTVYSNKASSQDGAFVFCGVRPTPYPLSSWEGKSGCRRSVLACDASSKAQLFSGTRLLFLLVVVLGSKSVGYGFEWSVHTESPATRNLIE